MLTTERLKYYRDIFVPIAQVTKEIKIYSANDIVNIITSMISESVENEPQKL